MPSIVTGSINLFVQFENVHTCDRQIEWRLKKRILLTVASTIRCLYQLNETNSRDMPPNFDAKFGAKYRLRLVRCSPTDLQYANSCSFYYLCPDGGPRASRMPAEDDYGPSSTRRQLLLHHAAASSGGVVAPVPSSQGGGQVPQPAATPATQSANTAADRYHTPAACPAGCSAAPDRLQASSQERLSERGSISSGSERLHPCYQAAASTERVERFSAGTQERFQGSTEKVESVDRLHARDERFPSAAVERLPTTDRYQTSASERYPASSDRHLTTERLQTSGHCPDRYRYQQQDRYTPVQNIGSLDRYGSLATSTAPTTDRYHTMDKYPTDDRTANTDRYTPVDRLDTNPRHTSSDRFPSTDRTDVYQQQQRTVAQQNPPTQSYPDRYAGRYHQERFQTGPEYQQERFNCERYPTIPCPERFATQSNDRTFSSQDRVQFPQVPYIPPPSPAPASDRFIPPPPLSPTNTPSPDCYPSNPFPSPTTAAPAERFIPPPPLSPSPTEKFSPKPDRFTEKRYPDRYTVSPNPEKYPGNDRYNQYHAPEPRYQDRYTCYATSDRYPQTPQYHHQTDRYGAGERYLPPTAHTPVERYVPQPQEPYYQTYERYPKWNQNNSGDPPGSSSSSSSVTSQGKDTYGQNQQQKELQCYHQPEMLQPPTFHQEKAIQCASFQGKDIQCMGFVSPSVRGAKVPCKHICSSPSVEYVGQSGGRHVCATPPPPRSASAGGEPHCGDQCCLRRPPPTTTLHTTTIW
ncbi:hypothetical protein CBL_13531 [Carabus blaptoides fortunei]